MPIETSDTESDEPQSAVYASFVRHHAALKRFIARFVGVRHEVDDIAQETFLRAFVAERGKAIEQPKPFLFRIARHLALNRLSRKARQITSYLEDCPDEIELESLESTEEEMLAAETIALHCEAVADLAPQCRQVYLLRKVHGMSHKEIAAHLGIAVSTVEKHLIKGVEHCDRYVRTRTAPAAAAAPSSNARKRERRAR